MLTVTVQADELINALNLKASTYCREGFTNLKRLRSLEKEGKGKPLKDLAVVSQAFIMSPKAIEGDRSKNVLPYYSASELTKAFPSPRYLLMDIDPRLEKWKIKSGYVLLTASGTVGIPIYPRQEFGDPFLVWGDMIRIRPNNVFSGYLYAYFSSRIFQSTLKIMEIGSVIQHLDPGQISEIPVPILESNLMGKIHSLIEEAATLKNRARQVVEKALIDFNESVYGIQGEHNFTYRNERTLACDKVVIDNYRLDGYHNVGYCKEGRNLISKSTVLGQYVEAYQPPLFKRPYVAEGIPFVSGVDLYDDHPKVTKYLSKTMAGLDKYLVTAGTILVQNVGQRYGIFGRPVVLHDYLNNSAVTQHLMRVYPLEENDQGFVYFFLMSGVGRRCLLGMSFGTSMGVLFEKSFLDCPCPEVNRSLRLKFKRPFDEFVNMRNKAIALEQEAIEMIEQEHSSWEE